jgi:hypothetical protein
MDLVGVCRIHAGIIISPRVTALVAGTGADLCGARPSKVYMAMAAFRLLRPGPLAADRERRPAQECFAQSPITGKGSHYKYQNRPTTSNIAKQWPITSYTGSRRSE